MLTHLIHKGELVPISEAHKLYEYYSPQYLRYVAQEREFTGTFSVTQCLDCPRAVLFKILLPYAVYPDDFAYMILGTRSHLALEKSKEEELAEVSVFSSEANVKGVADYLYKADGTWVLLDTKVWGSYAVVKNLGIEKKLKPMVDEHGNPVLYKTSREGKFKKGQQKMESYFVKNKEKVDNHDVKLQTNMYRVAIEKQRNIKINRLQVFVIVRDGGLLTAMNRGVDRKTYMDDLDLLPDKEVLEFFKNKTSVLTEEMNRLAPLTRKEILSAPPKIGTEREIFSGWKCEHSCPVAMYCDRCKNHPRKAEYSSFVNNPVIDKEFLC
jgi:hypothetical protein